MNLQNRRYKGFDAAEITNELFSELLSWEAQTRELAKKLLRANRERAPGAEAVGTVLLAAADSIGASEVVDARRGSSREYAPIWPLALPSWLYWPAMLAGFFDDLWRKAKGRS